MASLVEKLQERDDSIRRHLEFRTGKPMPKPITLEGMAAERIAELEAVLRALVTQVEYQDDVLDPTAGLVQAMRDAKSHLTRK